MSVALIANPNSGGGRTKKRLPEILNALANAIGPVTLYRTNGPGHATTLTRQALAEGAELIIAVGGDGTVNECINGFFDGDIALSPGAQFSFIMSGTGGDFRRTFGLDTELDSYIDAIASGRTQEIDLGRLRYTNNDGKDELRYFNNIASFGLSGRVDRAVNRAWLSKLFGGTFSFYWCTLTTMLMFKPQQVRIQVDDHFDETIAVNTAAICNGQYFGGGMWMAPDADPRDGLFDVVIIKDSTMGEMLKDTGAIYDGKHLDNPKVVTTRGSRVFATPINHENVLLDVDGEAPGRLPVTYEMVPKALTLRL